MALILATTGALVLKGLDPSMFVDKLNQLLARQRCLQGELTSSHEEVTPTIEATLLRSDLTDLYREKVASLTDACEDQGLRAEAFERIRSLIESVILTPEGDELAIHLRKLGAMLELCASDKQKPLPDQVCNHPTVI